MRKELDSNKLHSDIRNVCAPCGIAANVLTCLFLYGNPPEKLAFSTSTYHEGKCDFCKRKRSVTEARDFFYPDFNRLAKAKEVNQKRLKSKKK